jgi:LemA protein
MENDMQLVVGFLLLLIAVALILGVWAIGLYNGLVRLQNQLKGAWAQIEVQLRRRYDLLPNMVETVKGYTQHEQDTLEKVIQARGQALQARGAGACAQAHQQVHNAVGQLMVVVEQYPELKANQNFLSLQEELVSTENRIGFARQHYNERVMVYNPMLQSMPANVIGTMFAFKEEEFFEVEDAHQRTVPQIKFAA